MKTDNADRRRRLWNVPRPRKPSQIWHSNLGLSVSLVVIASVWTLGVAGTGCSKVDIGPAPTGPEFKLISASKALSTDVPIETTGLDAAINTMPPPRYPLDPERVIAKEQAQIVEESEHSVNYARLSLIDSIHARCIREVASGHLSISLRLLDSVIVLIAGPLHRHVDAVDFIHYYYANPNDNPYDELDDYLSDGRFPLAIYVKGTMAIRDVINSFPSTDKLRFAQTIALIDGQLFDLFKMQQEAEDLNTRAGNVYNLSNPDRELSWRPSTPRVVRTAEDFLEGPYVGIPSRRRHYNSNAVLDTAAGAFGERQDEQKQESLDSYRKAVTVLPSIRAKQNEMLFHDSDNLRTVFLSDSLH